MFLRAHSISNSTMPVELDKITSSLTQQFRRVARVCFCFLHRRVVVFGLSRDLHSALVKSAVNFQWTLITCRSAIETTHLMVLRLALKSIANSQQILHYFFNKFFDFKTMALI